MRAVAVVRSLTSSSTQASLPLGRAKHGSPLSFHTGMLRGRREPFMWRAERSNHKCEVLTCRGAAVMWRTDGAEGEMHGASRSRWVGGEGLTGRWAAGNRGNELPYAA